MQLNLHSKSVTITADMVEPREETLVLHFIVTNTGISIIDDTINKIFTPFTQRYLETTRVCGGTSVGRTISKNLAEI